MVALAIQFFPPVTTRVSSSVRTSVRSAVRSVPAVTSLAASETAVRPASASFRADRAAGAVPAARTGSAVAS